MESKQVAEFKKHRNRVRQSLKDEVHKLAAKYELSIFEVMHAIVDSPIHGIDQHVVTPYGVNQIDWHGGLAETFLPATIDLLDHAKGKKAEQDEEAEEFKATNKGDFAKAVYAEMKKAKVHLYKAASPWDWNLPSPSPVEETYQWDDLNEYQFNGYGPLNKAQYDYCTKVMYTEGKGTAKASEQAKWFFNNNQQYGIPPEKCLYSSEHKYLLKGNSVIAGADVTHKAFLGFAVAGSEMQKIKWQPVWEGVYFHYSPSLDLYTLQQKPVLDAKYYNGGPQHTTEEWDNLASAKMGTTYIPPQDMALEKLIAEEQAIQDAKTFWSGGAPPAGSQVIPVQPPQAGIKCYGEDAVLPLHAPNYLAVPLDTWITGQYAAKHKLKKAVQYSAYTWVAHPSADALKIVPNL